MSKIAYYDLAMKSFSCLDNRHEAEQCVAVIKELSNELIILYISLLADASRSHLFGD